MCKFIQSFKSLPSVVSLITGLSLTGCYQEAPVEDVVSGSGTKLNVITRSATSNAVIYPLSIYAFGADGSCKAQQVIEDESESVSLKLGKGNYRITAISGFGDFVFPQTPKKNALITTNVGNYSVTPLSVGQADVALSGSSSVTVQMSLQVASVEFALHGLPDDVTEVSVTIADVYSAITFGGECQSPEPAVLECSKVGGVWTTGKVYLLPLSSSSMVVSIIVADDTGSNTYGYTYNTPVRTGVPYQLNGTFSAGIVLNGTVEAIGWDEDVVLDFDFGTNVSDSGGDEGEEPSASEEVTVAEIPEACSLWQGHVVAMVGNVTSSEADLLLLALPEEVNVMSKVSDEPDAAAQIAQAYSEYGLTGWHVPTKDEATALRNSYYGDNISAINSKLEEAGGKALTQTDSHDKNVRYLCEDALYTYSFATSSDGGVLQITKAGATVKYRLRLVKTIHVKKQ